MQGGIRMKNLKYFPYERNRYFYGKLLSVDDFEAEQKYMNDKRRLINRFMHGFGIVCGLNVIRAGDGAVCVEAGVALDFSGREIILDEPVTRKLSEIDGFASYAVNDKHNSYLYLCIDYAEYDKNPVYSITGGNTNSEQLQYNRTAEGYHLYLTENEPEIGNSGSAAFYEEHKVLYWENGIRISQIFPRYVHSGDEFDACIVIENMGQQKPISFHYELLLECLKCKGRQWLRVEFDEQNMQKARRYELPITLQAADANNVYGSARLKENTFYLKIGESEFHMELQLKNEVKITNKPVADVLDRYYYTEAMRAIKNETFHQSIYLAKISLFAAGTTVLIDDVEENPFGQYLCNDILSGIRGLAFADAQKMLFRRIDKLSEQLKAPKTDVTEPNTVQSVSGTTVIDLGIGGIAGQTFFSKPVVHGLGPGAVTVFCGIAEDMSNTSSVLYGEPDIFRDETAEIRAKTAIKADFTNGTFTVGIKLLEVTTANKAKIYWTAFRDSKEDSAAKEKRSLFIKPDMVYLRLREDYYFEAIFTGTQNRKVLWSVKEPDGGFIDENGRYTAPSLPGIYEIIATSAAYPELTASSFVIVRDIGGKNN